MPILDYDWNILERAMSAIRMRPISKSSPLAIDEDRATRCISTYIQNVVQQQVVQGVLIGLSGGIDSALLAALAVHSLGKDFVHLAYLYDQHSTKQLRTNARRISSWLGLELEEISIEPAMRQKGVYDSVVMRMTAFSGLFNRLLHEAYRLFSGESLLLSSLRAGGEREGSEGHTGLGSHALIRQPEAGLNARHIYRRQFLETRAKEENWLLLGAANRSECLTGWFVRDGIDDLPIQPLKGFYKTQIRSLAASMGVPREVLEQTPSPDMVKGIGDEFALGIAYWKIDLVLDYLEGGLAKDDLLAAGCVEKEISHVSEMVRLSAWKRNATLPTPPIDGTIAGGLRLKG
jgi:NAD+ synthase